MSAKLTNKAPITFCPDNTIFHDVKADSKRVAVKVETGALTTHLREMAFLNKRLTITLKDKRNDGNSETYLHPAHDLIFSFTNVYMQQKLKSMGNPTGDLRNSQLIFAVVNALIHSVNETDPVDSFKNRLAQSQALSNISARFTEEDRQELLTVIAKARAMSWMA